MFFITLDITRAIGLDKALPDLKIVCLHQSPLIEKLRNAGTPVYCIEEKLNIHDMRNSADMILSPEVQEWMKQHEVTPEVLFFKPTAKLEAIIRHHGWKVLNSDSALNTMFEDKVDFVKICQELHIPMPPNEVLALGEITNDTLTRFGSTAILQLRRGHAGETSFMIRNFEDILKLQKTHNPTHQVKLASLIQGRTLTLNACISGENVLIGDLMEQITGIPTLNANTFGTCGVVVRLLEPFPSTLRDMVLKLGKYMQSKGYHGIFGIDVIEDSDRNIFMIECNPRLTATVSFHTQLQMCKGEVPFISLMTGREKNQNAKSLPSDSEPCQLILRNTTSDEVIIQHSLVPGVYQNDKGNLEFVRRAYTFDSLQRSDELLLLIRPSGSRVSPHLEIGYVQSLRPLVQGVKVDESINKILKSVSFQPPWYIPKDAFWTGRFGTVVKLQDIFSKPLRNLGKMSARALTRSRQTQALPDEPPFAILGEYDQYFLIRKYEGTIGWIPKTVISEAKSAECEMKTQTSNEFFDAFQSTPYLWGGLSSEGIDCSGLTQLYFRNVLGKIIPKNSKDQRKLGTLIHMNSIRDNDLIFLTSRATTAHHVALFHNNSFIHACLKEGRVVRQDFDSLTRDYEIEEIRRI